MIPVMKTYRSLPTLMEEFLKDDFFGGKTLNKVRYSCPAANILENENGYNIEIAAPGLERGDIKVTVDSGVLTISSAKNEKTDDKKKSYLKKEFSFESFSRSFGLPENVDVEKIAASHKDGILTISIPKKAVVQIPVHEVEVK